MEKLKTYEELISEIKDLQWQLGEANDTINAIRTGQIDALVIKGKNGHELYTLKTADQNYRVFIEKMTEGAITLNDKGIIIYCNSKFASIAGFPLSKVTGQFFKDFVADEYQQFYNELFVKGWKEECKGEIMIKSKNNPVFVQISITLLQLDEGSSLSIIVTDLTLQKETQKQLKINNDQLEDINLSLEASNNDLQQFAYVASHDLQEPLRKIQIYSDILKQKFWKDTTSEANNYLERINASSKRMKTLISDILNYSRLSQNNDGFMVTDLSDLLKDIVEDFDMLIAEKNATVHISGLPVLEVNAGQIRQVFQNLISNSLKFISSEHNPVITITAHKVKENSFTSDKDENGSFCHIRVKDNGIGFDDSFANTIFTLFNRLHTKDKYEGTGIGLAIARKIIERHNGSIMAKSNEGEGSEFCIILPVKQPVKKSA